MSNKGFASVLLVIFILVAVLIAGSIFFILKDDIDIPKIIQQTSPSSKEWFGVIATKDGLVKIDPQGKLERDSSNKVKIIVPPWSKALDEGVAVPRDLLEDGRIVFIGSPKIPLATKENILYSWAVDSSTSPSPLLELSNGQKIQSFAISPDHKQVAVISVTRTADEIYEGEELRNLSLEESKQIIEERTKKLEGELGIVSIFDIKTGEVTNELVLKPVENSSRDTAAKLIWKKPGLLVLELRELNLYYPQNGQIIDTIEDTSWIQGRTEPLRDVILVSPDGSMYFNPAESSVRKIPVGEIIAKITAPEIVNPESIDESKDLEQQIIWAGHSAFSEDSKKLVVQGRSVTQNNFIVWELDLESGQTKKIGDSEILKFGSIPVAKLKSLFLFLTYSPLGDRIFFAANYPDGDPAATDLFQLKQGEQKAEFINLFDGINISFLGWYSPN